MSYLRPSIERLKGTEKITTIVDALSVVEGHFAIERLKATADISQAALTASCRGTFRD